MDEAIFFISGGSSGADDDDGYEVLNYDFQSGRQIDIKGAPASPLYGMVIEVEIYSSVSKAIMIGAMFDQFTKVKGKIEVYTNDSGERKKYKTISFENGHIFKYCESFVLSQNKRLTEKISITAEKVDMDGTKHSMEWGK